MQARIRIPGFIWNWTIPVGATGNLFAVYKLGKAFLAAPDPRYLTASQYSARCVVNCRGPYYCMHNSGICFAGTKICQICQRSNQYYKPNFHNLKYFGQPSKKKIIGWNRCFLQKGPLIKADFFYCGVISFGLPKGNGNKYKILMHFINLLLQTLLFP